MNMHTRADLPAWLQTKDQTHLNFEKQHDFVGVNIASLGKLLHFFTNITPVHHVKSSPWLRVCSLLITSLLVLLSHDLIFLWACLLLYLGQLAFFPGNAILMIFKKYLKLIIFTAIFILPSLFLSQKADLPLFFMRISVLLLALAYFSGTTTWQQFIFALKQLHFPSVLILTLDITVKYCYLAGIYLQESLYSIRFKTLGQKASFHLLGNLIGELYLSLKSRMNYLYQAMVLRGYKLTNKNQLYPKITQNDLLPLLELGLLCLLFWWL